MRYVITHGHIFKNAGTTFDFALKKAFGSGFVDHRDDKAMLQGGKDYLEDYIIQNPELKAISSHHLCNPLPTSDDFICVPIYFLRNPIERIISVYNFERKQNNDTLGAKMASKLDLEEYVHWRFSGEAPKVISNYQTAYLGRNRPLFPDEDINFSIFHNALQRIQSGEAIVGTVERFEESFSKIKIILNKYFPDTDFSYERKNISNRNSTKSKLNDSITLLKNVLPEIIEQNSYDLALHKFANEILNGYES